MKSINFLRRAIIALSLISIVLLFIFSRYYVVTEANENKKLKPVNSFINENNEAKKFLDSLEPKTAPFSINKDDFNKENIFE